MTYSPKLPPRDDFAERIIAKQRANRPWPLPAAAPASRSPDTKNIVPTDPPETPPE